MTELDYEELTAIINALEPEASRNEKAASALAKLNQMWIGFTGRGHFRLMYLKWKR